ncbi:MAG: sodium:calcium antiporter [Oscillospiraceae bacterium]|nr:sodium:calcium antiporter [Oscillospiraceae bacterium]
MSAMIFLFFLGLFMLILGGDSFAEHVSALAARLRVPPIIVGATVAAVGTTLPELSVSVKAALSGAGEITTGTAFGSIICNSCLIGGLCALLLPSSDLWRKDIVKRLFFFLLAACFIALSAAKTEELGVGLGIILLSILAIYALTNRQDNISGANINSERPELICVGLLVGAAALYLGSGMLVDNGILLAEIIGMPPKTVALTFIAAGTSLPELTMAVFAARRGRSGLAIGTLIGANILNLLLVLGLPAVITPIAADREIYRDITSATVAMAALIMPPAFRGRTYRWQGVVLLLMYAGYIVINFI